MLKPVALISTLVFLLCLIQTHGNEVNDFEEEESKEANDITVEVSSLIESPSMILPANVSDEQPMHTQTLEATSSSPAMMGDAPVEAPGIGPSSEGGPLAPAAEAFEESLVEAPEPAAELPSKLPVGSPPPKCNDFSSRIREAERKCDIMTGLGRNCNWKIGFDEDTQGVMTETINARRRKCCCICRQTHGCKGITRINGRCRFFCSSKPACKGKCNAVGTVV